MPARETSCFHGSFPSRRRDAWEVGVICLGLLVLALINSSSSGMTLLIYYDNLSVLRAAGAVRLHFLA